MYRSRVKHNVPKKINCKNIRLTLERLLQKHRKNLMNNKETLTSRLTLKARCLPILNASFSYEWKTVPLYTIIQTNIQNLYEALEVFQIVLTMKERTTVQENRVPQLKNWLGSNTLVKVINSVN